MLLAGDIGGTKTLLALYAPATGARQPVAEAEFHSASYPGLDVMAREFLAQAKRTADHACFDVAGPVIGGRAHLTNLPWDLEEAALRQSLGLQRVMLLNDLKAIAYAVPHLGPADLHAINVGRPEKNGPIAVVAPGTGLGEAFLVWGGNSYIACSSEGGHASFAPTDERQAGLRQYLAQRFGHVSCERVCSGLGIANVYDYLRETDPAAEPAAFAAELSRAQRQDAADRAGRPDRPVRQPAGRGDTGDLRVDPGRRGQQSGAQGTGDRWCVPGGRDPGAYPAETDGWSVHARFHQQGPAVGPARQHADPRRYDACCAARGRAIWPGSYATGVNDRRKDRDNAALVTMRG